MHTLVPPALAPPELVAPLREYFVHHPFDLNVLGMTRFPDKRDYSDDPLGPAIEAAREVCGMHGLDFQLASEGTIHGDLWPNVAGYMWGSRYGLAFFEDRTGEGINYNLTIEVGSMMMAGRRCLLLKDNTIKKMPTDLVGKIYTTADFSKVDSVREAVHRWIRDDLRLPACRSCPPKPGGKPS